MPYHKRRNSGLDTATRMRNRIAIGILDYAVPHYSVRYSPAPAAAPGDSVLGPREPTPQWVIRTANIGDGAPPSVRVSMRAIIPGRRWRHQHDPPYLRA